MIRNLRKGWKPLQRAVMSRASEQGITQDCAASHLGCSSARVSWWSAADARAMGLEDLLGLLELADRPAEVLRPLLDQLGLIAVERPATEGELVGRLEGGALRLTVGLGELAREVSASSADGEIDAAERARLLDHLAGLRREADALTAALSVGPRAVGGGR